MLKLLIGLALSMFAAVASAEWVNIAMIDNGGTKFYAQPTTKKRMGNVVRMWGLQDNSKPSVHNGKTFYSVQTYWQFDCFEDTVQLLQSTAFAGKMATGEIILGDQVPSDKMFARPGSIQSDMLNFACK